MKQKLILLFALWLFAGSLCPAQTDEVAFRASAPEAVAMGQQFKIVYTLTNAQGTELRAPNWSEDFNELMGPTVSNNYVSRHANGVQTSVSTQTFTYILMPKKEGTFNIAPGTIKVKNATFTSNALVIKVLPPNQSGSTGPHGESAGNTAGTIGSDDLFVRMEVSKRSVYEQEGFLVTFKIYAGTNLGGEVKVTNLKYPEFEGFLTQDIDLQPQWTLENYNGRNYQTAVMKQTVLYPQRTGKITIESGKYNAVVSVRVQRRVRSFFDDLFSIQEVNKELTNAPATIDVKPLPSGKPASFSGAVGSYAMKTSISATNVKANEAITVTLNLSGNGNIRVAKNPDVIFPNDFEVYDPKVNTNLKTTTAGTSGTKTIEYMAIPRFGGDFEIPTIFFSYFDPKDGTYKTLHSEAYKLHVEKGAGGESAETPTVSNYTNKQNKKVLGADIYYIKTGSVHFQPNREIFFGSATHLLAYATIAVLFIAFAFIYRRQMKENANLALVRTKKANKTAVRRLKKANKLLREHRKEEFYDEVLRAIWGYLSDKLSIPLSHLTKDNVEAELAKYGVVEAREFTNILDTCEFARYAPTQAPDAMDHLYKQTVDAIDRMENTIKK